MGRERHLRTRSRTILTLTEGTEVLGLDLFGHKLALNLNDESTDAGVCGRREVRLLKLGANRTRLIASQTCGLDGQTFLSPSFDTGWL